MNYIFVTSLHGWKYLESEESRASKVYWVFIILCVISASGYFIITYIKQFISESTVTRYKALKINELILTTSRI